MMVKGGGEGEDDELEQEDAVPTKTPAVTDNIHLIEFFSGVGGMRLGVERALKELNAEEDEELSSEFQERSSSSSSSSSPPSAAATTPSSSRTCSSSDEEEEATSIGSTSSSCCCCSKVESSDHRRSCSNNNARRRRRYGLSSCRAFEIADNANRIYRHNFSSARAAAAAAAAAADDCNKKQRSFTLTCKQIERLELSEIIERFPPPPPPPPSSSRSRSVDSCDERTDKDDTNDNSNVAAAADDDDDDDDDDTSNKTIWTLSPPCQPFTRKPGAKHLDVDDSRCGGLRDGVMRLLRTMDAKDRPNWILLENVKGFAGSRMNAEWKKCLDECGYTYKEFLLCPTQFGIPNYRKRYYMICERSSRFLGSNSSGQDGNDEDTVEMTVEQEGILASAVEGCPRKDVRIRPVADYVVGLRGGSDSTDYDRESIAIPDIVLEQKWAKDLDFVTVSDRITHCFTSSYGRILHASSGSLLLLVGDDDGGGSDGGDEVDCWKDEEGKKDDSVAFRAEADKKHPVGAEEVCRRQQRRRFSPKEVANFLHFPPEFDFPKDLAIERQYKHICNAVNVKVISHLVKELLSLAPSSQASAAQAQAPATTT